MHAHQVLQHISDPVQAIKEMRRVTKKDGGVVSLRESDSMSWFPANKGIEDWFSLTTEMGRAKGGTPHPGRFLHSWACRAGFSMRGMERSVGGWCFSEPAEREYWGGSMARRMEVEGSGFAEMAVAQGFATGEELQGIARGWREWVGEEEGWFGVLHGQVLCWK